MPTCVPQCHDYARCPSIYMYCTPIIVPNLLNLPQDPHTHTHTPPLPRAGAVVGAWRSMSCSLCTSDVDTDIGWTERTNITQHGLLTGSTTLSSPFVVVATSPTDAESDHYSRRPPGPNRMGRLLHPCQSPEIHKPFLEISRFLRHSFILRRGRERRRREQPVVGCG